MTVPAYGDVEKAAARLRGIAARTPVFTSRTADGSRGAQFFFKMESLQRTGSFKFRGAYHAIARVKDAGLASVVAFSSGNHAQAVALSASMLDVKATIIMPADAPAAKISATRGYGARVVLYDRAREDRQQIADEFASREGAILVPPFDHADIIAGQGTAARELIEEIGALDYLYVPVGGGGLISGSALVAAALSPGCKVVGVEPLSGDDVRQSIELGERVRIAVPVTIADGAQTTQVGALTFPIIQQLVHEILVVDDDALRHQMRFFMERMKSVVEPTGCLAAAGAMATAPKGSRVGVIVSGGNVDLALAPDILRRQGTATLTIG